MALGLSIKFAVLPAFRLHFFGEDHHAEGGSGHIDEMQFVLLPNSLECSCIIPLSVAF